jgi:hypothetical protein
MSYICSPYLKERRSFSKSKIVIVSILSKEKNI